MSSNRGRFLGSVLLAAIASSLVAESGADLALHNWTVPPYHPGSGSGGLRR